jgi:succinyl-CoA synthetase beta subunit
VRLVDSPQDAFDYAARLIGSRLVTHQTGKEGVPVHKVLVEETASVSRELYLALTVDRSAQGPVFIASAAGGMDIEEVSAKHPEKIYREGVDIAIGLQPFQARRIARALGLAGDQAKAAGAMLTAIYRMFMELDCTLVEVNPLAVTSDGKVIALDAKVNLEDDALFRHPDLASLADPAQEDPSEAQAHEAKVAFVKLEGSVGCLVNGAGLAMATMDVVRRVGATPANFLDVGGGADDEKVVKAVNIMLSDPGVKGILINIFGGILRCDIVARGVVRACQERGARLPIIARLQGTNQQEGRDILSQSGLDVSFADTFIELEAQLKKSLSALRPGASLSGD